MKKKIVLDATEEAKYYDEHGVLKEIIDEPVAMGLETELRRAIPTEAGHPDGAEVILMDCDRTDCHRHLEKWLLS